MITPSFSLSATERVLPRLALDFTTASLDPRVTFTRSGDTATVINSSGLIETVSANTPRFDHNLNTGGACKGLLIEETRTNVCLHSANISNAVWATVYGSFTGTGSQTDPSGGTTATILTGGGGFAQLVTGLSVNTTYTYSFYAKSVSGIPGYRVVSGGGTNLVGRTSYAGQLNATTFTRVSVSFTTGAADTSVRIYPLDTGSATSVVLAFHQLEAGAFATSYIPTTTTALTRNADVATMTGTNFSDWYNATEGTMSVGLRLTPRTPSGTAVILYNGDATGRWSYLVNSSARIFDNTNTATAGNVVATGALNKIVSGFSASGIAIALNGATTATSSFDGTFGPATSLLVGSQAGTGNINGIFQYINYYPQKLTNAEMQAFSK
jgi:hypothetical protein